MQRSSTRLAAPLLPPPQKKKNSAKRRERLRQTNTQEVPYQAVVPMSSYRVAPLVFNPFADPSVADDVRVDSMRVRILEHNVYPGDSVGSDQQVYGITFVNFQGLCDCNLHADDCVQQQCPSIPQTSCVCGNNTAGRNCEYCVQGYQQEAWQVGPDFACQQCQCLPAATLPVDDPTSPLAACTDEQGACPCIDSTITGDHCDQPASAHFAALYSFLSSEIEDAPLAAGAVSAVLNAGADAALDGRWWSGRGYVALAANESIVVTAPQDAAGSLFQGSAADTAPHHFVELRAEADATISINGSVPEPVTQSAGLIRLAIPSAHAVLEVVAGGPVFFDRVFTVPATFLSLPKLNVSEYPDFPRASDLSALYPTTCDIFNTDATGSGDEAACQELAFAESVRVYGRTFPCDCDTRGTEPGTTCDPMGGQCACRENAVGLRCDACDLGFYLSDSDGCVPCGCAPGDDPLTCTTCSSYGTVDAVCSADGECR